jgi:hypothetical protein
MESTGIERRCVSEKESVISEFVGARIRCERRKTRRKFTHEKKEPLKYI